MGEQAWHSRKKQCHKCSKETKLAFKCEHCGTMQKWEMSDQIFFFKSLSSRAKGLYVIGMIVIFYIFYGIGTSIGSSSSSSRSSSSSSSYNYYCDECGRGFSGQPYQCIFYNCVKAKTISSALDKFCSCTCGVRNRAKAGFDYNCQ